MQLVRPVVHLLRFGPTPGKVLVRVHRHRAARFLKYLHYLLEKLKPRVELLLPVVERVVAMFGYQEHSVYCKLSASERQRLLDRPYYWKIVGRGEAIPDVRGMDLVQEQRYDVAGRRVVAIVNPVALQEPGDEVIAMRADVISGGDGGDPFPPGCRSKRRGCW